MKSTPSVKSIVGQSGLFFIAVVLCLSLQGCATTSPAVQSSTLAAGDKLFDQGAVLDALAAWETVSATTSSLTFELALRQSRAYREIGNTKLALQAATTAVAQAASAAPRLQILAGIELGLAQIALFQLDEARQSLLTAQAKVAQQPFWTELAQIEVGLALINKLENHAELALAHYQTAEQRAQQGNDMLLATSVALMRLQLLTDTDANAARMLWQSVRDKVRALPPSNRRDFALISLARLAQNEALFTKDDKRSLALLQEAEQSSRGQFKDNRLLSYSLGYQGYWQEQNGYDAQAEQLTAAAADAAQRVNALESLYLWEWQAARLHQRGHRETEALAAYRRAVFDLQQVRQNLATGQSFRQRVSPLFLGLADMLLKKARASTDAASKEDLLKEARSTLEQLKSAELQDYFQDRCIANFKEKSQGLTQMIPPNTAVLYPILLPDRTEIVVGFNDGLQQFIMPVTSATMNAEIRDFRFLLEKRATFQYLKPAKRLYDWLIAPLLSELQHHQVHTLVVVPEGALRTMPFAALYDGKKYVVDQFALATTPGLSLTEAQALPHEKLHVLLNGLSESVQGFSSLPNVAHELTTLQSEFSDATVLENDSFLLLALGDTIEKNPYQIIHIASHGQFNRDPKKTFLLTYDGRMTMDILERYLTVNQYRNKPVELLTLSACQTATGDDRSALGMAGVAIKAGARSALASLWFINDQSSSKLVAQFYAELKQYASKAESLRQAQLALLKDPRYRHASYWAAFLLIGNWL